MPGGQFYLPASEGEGGFIPDVNVFQEGQEVEFEMVITAHHRGWIQMRLCDEARVTEECLQKYAALQRVRYGLLPACETDMEYVLCSPSR